LTIEERIKLLRLELGLNQSEFAERIGIKQAGLSAIEKGIRGLTDRNLSLICEKFNVSEDWLRTGEGEMFFETEHSIMKDLVNQYDLSEDAKICIECLLKLSPSDMRVLTNYIKTVASAYTQKGSSTNTNNIEFSEEITPICGNDVEIEMELDALRLELLDEKRGKILSASPALDTKRNA